MGRDAGFELAFVDERPHDIRVHYDKLAERFEQPIEGLDAKAKEAISQSIGRWQAALAGGHITWAYFVARKPA